MNKQPLHITNTTTLTTTINNLGIKGEKLLWEAMLCEGPTTQTIYSKDFLKIRTSFFNTFYNINLDIIEINKELEKLNNTNQYSEIILWFDYNLFCHINMIAVISLIQQKKIDCPLYLVCSGRVEGSQNLKKLSELSKTQLLDHYKNKVQLTSEDIDLATSIWGIYCGIDHNLLKPYIMKSSSFKYLNNCLMAHLERFPDVTDGLTVLERNILKIIDKYNIVSKNQLLGYTFNYQGYYGYENMQLMRIIESLNTFYSIEKKRIILNRKGHEALLKDYHVSLQVDDNMIYGGVKKYAFKFSQTEDKLIKTI